MLTVMVDKAAVGQVFLLSLSFLQRSIPNISIIYDRRRIYLAVYSVLK